MDGVAFQARSSTKSGLFVDGHGRKANEFAQIPEWNNRQNIFPNLQLTTGG